MLNYFLMPWKKYADFSGRAQRAEYWVFELGNFLIAMALLLVGTAIGQGNENYVLIPYGLFILVSLVPSIAVSVRRLHDTGRSAWWILISLIPFVGAIWFFVLTVFDSKLGSNKYGPNPKEKNSSSGPQSGLSEGVRMS